MKCRLNGQRGGGLHKYCDAADPQRNNNLATSHIAKCKYEAITTIYKLQRSRSGSAAQFMFLGLLLPLMLLLFQIVE